ncbi:MAG: geranylgeranylglycerol-phosphate geranylgeranyltransferase [Saprospiraceae bacterium]|nr:geranylgeranylglycerol-phosphate geranylgeranyltransferase [Saprospiraceae bacterium]MCF8248599.1 geranylgeranylglycerol-phosphate geranylgeranyltransferase [Saprospiraceae bacterium]MCF8281037.1 geranylgeranylglycerol-phosphate geranylgeranyltransferase [Bacteroidales bacterium]MCF8310332.1 geranylgeranylglycerol-phosphate geranylgeranyltransferase [Saprospiraceae bacterium]MCF8442087.1 geranylgeranylglycerol-phosphate geranylgeranyltransferase [Saprospiraceae bacterium]
MKILSFFKLVRFPNLVIVALTQYLLQYLVLVPALREAGLTPILDAFHFFLLVLTTVLIAAGGYLINDLLDYESDLINKPDSVFVNRVFPKKMVEAFYYTIFLVGFAIAWHLAVYVKKLVLVQLYPAAFLLLYFYSKKLKKIPLWGNVTVALFCAFVAGVVLFAERQNFAQMADEGGVVTVLFGGYLWFAFLSTLLREIVKDIEDMEGDARLGLQTLPLRFGENMAKKMGILVGVGLLLSLLVFVFWLWQRQEFLSAIFSLLVVTSLICYTLIILKKATTKADFSRVSFLSKMVMLSGLVLLLVCKFA